MNRKVEQGDATRRKLIRVAIAMFTERGFASTSTSDIVRAAQVTRGALYHHFADKEALFEGAFTEIEKEVYGECAAAAAAAPPGDPPGQLAAGIGAFLDACLRPEVQRIILLDGPAILGWQRSLRFSDPYCARQLLRAGLAGAQRAGLLPPGQAEPLTHLLYGALSQAGVVIAAADDPAAARAGLGEAVTSLLQSHLRHRDGQGPLSRVAG